MNQIDKIEKRIDNIEKTLDVMKNNHLYHIEKYTKYTMMGCIATGICSIGAVYLAVVA